MKRFVGKNDLIMIGMLLACSAVMVAVLFFTKTKGANVVVSIDSVKTYSFPLNEDLEYEIEGYNGGKNMLVIEGGEAFLKDASCPDHLCIHMGKIKNVGQSIICLPNRVVIEIEDEKNSQQEFDTISS